VGAYHSQAAARSAWYANRIAAILMRWKVIAPGALPFPPAPPQGPARVPGPARRVPSPSSPASATAVDGVPQTAAFREIAYLPTAR